MHARHASKYDSVNARRRLEMPGWKSRSGRRVRRYRLPMDGRDYTEVVRPLIAGRRVILAGGPVAGFTPTTELLHRLGAEAILVVGSEGPASVPCRRPTWPNGWPPRRRRRRRRSRPSGPGNRLLLDPPPAIRDAGRAVRPDRRCARHRLVPGRGARAARPAVPRLPPARVAGAGGQDHHRRAVGRAGVARAPRSSCRSSRRRAARRRGASTPAPARCGRPTRRRAATAAPKACAGCARRGRRRRRGRRPSGRARDRVRVMPFLEGVPCTIHGVVFPDHVIVVRPVEQITLRHAAGPTFLYAGCATFCDPPAARSRGDAATGPARRRAPARRPSATGARSPSTAWWPPTASGRPS